jgi:hypothetical protein
MEQLRVFITADSVGAALFEHISATSSSIFDPMFKLEKTLCMVIRFNPVTNSTAKK